MKKSLLMLLTFALTAIPVFANASSESAIRATDQAFATAWNHHDARAMAATWTKDGDLVNPYGRTAKGRASIETMIHDEHAVAFKNSTYTPGTMSIRFIQPTLAVSDSDSVITGAVNVDGSNSPAMNVHITRVIEKVNGQWLTVAARPVIYPATTH
jgi:uncharacterized protein (TIGR02246 family)